jgi:UDP-glucose 4-epimerase
MKYIVTGGAGFIGSRLVETLLDDPQNVVIVIDKLPLAERPRLKKARQSGGSRLTEHVADISSNLANGFVENANADALIHLAAQTDVSRSMWNPIEDATANLVGTERMLIAAMAGGVRRFVMAGSAAAYGSPTANTEPTTEQSRKRPDSWYGLHKKFATDMGWMTGGTQFKLLTFSNVYGPRSGANAVQTFIRDQLSNKMSVVRGTDVVRDYVYVDDVVRALTLAAAHDGKDPLEANISSKRPTTNGQLYAAIQSITGADVGYSAKAPREGEVLYSLLDNTHAREVLGWTPQIPLEEGLRHCVEHERLERPVAEQPKPARRPLRVLIFSSRSSPQFVNAPNQFATTLIRHHQTQGDHVTLVHGPTETIARADLVDDAHRQELIGVRAAEPNLERIEDWGLTRQQHITDVNDIEVARLLQSRLEDRLKELFEAGPPDIAYAIDLQLNGPGFWAAWSAANAGLRHPVPLLNVAYSGSDSRSPIQTSGVTHVAPSAHHHHELRKQFGSRASVTVLPLGIRPPLTPGVQNFLAQHFIDGTLGSHSGPWMYVLGTLSSEIGDRDNPFREAIDVAGALAKKGRQITVVAPDSRWCNQRSESPRLIMDLRLYAAHQGVVFVPIETVDHDTQLAVLRVAPLLLGAGSPSSGTTSIQECQFVGRRPIFMHHDTVGQRVRPRQDLVEEALEMLDMPDRTQTSPDLGIPTMHEQARRLAAIGMEMIRPGEGLTAGHGFEFSN